MSYDDTHAQPRHEGRLAGLAHAAAAEPASPQTFLLTFLTGILPRPQLVRVEEETAGEVIVLTIHLPAEDRRFVVGKGGRNIEAIRQLLRAFAGRQGRMIVAKLPDEPLMPEDMNEQSIQPRRSL